MRLPPILHCIYELVGTGGRRDMEDEVEMPWKTPSVAGTWKGKCIPSRRRAPLVQTAVMCPGIQKMVIF